LERIEVPFASLRAFRSVPREERPQFEIAEDGAFIHWPRPDLHFDLEGLREAIDPSARLAAIKEKLLRNRRFGHAVALVRQRHGLTQDAIEGVSGRQVRRIEGGALPRPNTLELFARAHHLGLRGYLLEVAEATGPAP
jgi:hypothetical protein